VLCDHGIEALKYYDGAGAVRFVWSWGVPDPDDLAGGLRRFQDSIARRLRDLLEERLDNTPERDRIGRWLGYEGDVTTIVPPRTNDVGQVPDAVCAEDRDRIRFEFMDMEEEGLLRVPYSLHEATGAAARPVSRADLFRFVPERDAAPERARRLRRAFEIPINFPRTVFRDLGT
jgi:hypothetical protein